jgi:DNA-binding GntR family transcriptional regulator
MLDKRNLFLYTILEKKGYVRMRQRLTIERLHSELRQQIVNRSIPPGAKLSESFLCKRWNVSRTPLREVLRQLESEGLVTSHRNKGFMINPITLEDVTQLYPIRMSLEGLAGNLATPILSGDPKKLNVLKKSCIEMERLFKKGDIEAYIAKNNEFHSFIWGSCGNKWLIKILENLSSHVNRFMVKSLHVPHRIDKSVREHREIYEKLKLGNGKAVEKAIQNNHRKAFEDLKREFINSL